LQNPLAMRRLLAVTLALAAPLAALAQTSGTILFTPTSPVVNAAQCSASDQTTTISLAWLTTLTSGSTFNSNGAYYVFAASSDPGNTTPYCANLTAGGLVATTPSTPDATLQTGSATVKTSALAAAAGYDCTADKTIYVCVAWFSDSGADPFSAPLGGYAKGTVSLSVSGPDQPTVTSVTPGEKALNVKISVPSTGTTADTWRARAVATSDPACGGDTATHTSSSTAIGTAARITGLVNLCPYTVTAVTYSADDNPSPESDPYGVAVAPEPVKDLWDLYTEAGGRDSGGCQAGGLGLLSLLGAAALARIRRRA
jgi:hypothetical protein